MPLSAKFIERYRVDKPDRFRLADFDTADTAGLNLDKDEVKALLAEDAERLGELQERLYAEDKWAVLVVLQGMDTAGKDGVIKHVMAGVNPQGCIVHSFKAPSAEEIDHDFLWRSAVRLPERGRIGIFNRSHYEEVLVVRVHPDLLARQKLPPSLGGKDIWKQRFKSIRAFERHLARNGTIVLKFFLHISPEEQRQRLLARLDGRKCSVVIFKGVPKNRERFSCSLMRRSRSAREYFWPWISHRVWCRVRSNCKARSFLAACSERASKS
jgi:PPK2 family polyphosphate:nucleotide phosphotransferase